jgi:hypothetical protein
LFNSEDALPQQCCLSDVKEAVHVDGERATPLQVRDLAEVVHGVPQGLVVDEQIETAQCFGRIGDDVAAVGCLGEVTGQGGRASAPRSTSAIVWAASSCSLR